jgi:hypothetical protein
MQRQRGRRDIKRRRGLRDFGVVLLIRQLGGRATGRSARCPARPGAFPRSGAPVVSLHSGTGPDCNNTTPTGPATPERSRTWHGCYRTKAGFRPFSALSGGHSVARSGGSASRARSSTIWSSGTVLVCFSPSRRTVTVPSCTSRWPMARMTGTLPTECSRTL